MSTVQSFAIIGAGALGAYYGARLVQGGQDVHFLLRSDYDTWRTEGLQIHSHAGDFALRPDQLHIYRQPDEMPKPNWVIVALKSTDNDQFEALIRPLLGEQTAIVTLQNGLGNEQRLTDLFGPQRILGGVAFICVNRLRPGVIDHTSHGLIRLGEFDRPMTARTALLATIFNACRVPCEPTDSLVTVRWEKLIWNIPFNGLSAILDQTTDQILATADGEQLVRRIMAEVIAGGRACGASLSDDLIDINLARTREMGAYRTSMQVDRQMGRELEIEAILHQPLEAAKANDVHVTNLQNLYDRACMIGTHNMGSV
jgi:2-dehydropantoate 2-reductase